MGVGGGSNFIKQRGRYDSSRGNYCKNLQISHPKIDTFKLWCWRRLLRVLWMTRSSNQSILKEINPDCSLEGLVLKLKLQYFGHLMRRANSLVKTLMLGKIRTRREGATEIEMVGCHHRINEHEFEQTPGGSEGQGSPACCSPCGHRVRHMFSNTTEQYSW